MSRDELIVLARRQDRRITALSSQVDELLEANEAFDAGAGEQAQQIAELAANNAELPR